MLPIVVSATPPLPSKQLAWAALLTFGLSLILLPSAAAQNQQVPFKTSKERIAAFTASDWPKVRQSADEFEMLQAAAIPDLIALLDRTEVVQLTETFDLIYPGATKFYGHGGLIPYELNTIAPRAGWALEKLTFQQFGFFCDYKADNSQKLIQWAKASANAKAWWAKARPGWTRFGALVEALRSDNERRQTNAISYLLRREFKYCDGLDLPSNRQLIDQEMQKLMHSKSEQVREEAKMYLEGAY